MAKGKRSGRPPQPQHAAKSNPSRHDKRQRLSTPNPLRRATDAAAVPLVGSTVTLVQAMSRMLDKRIGFRLSIVIAGAILAGGRRTAASWFRCGGVKDDWDRFYELLAASGKDAASVMLPMLPTPGPGDGDWLYGHNWVCLAMLLEHPLFGVIALPLLSRLYVRQIDIAGLKERSAWEFRTKHQLALEMLRHVIRTLRAFGSQAGVIVVFDGAYAARELVRSLIAEGAVVVTRLRCDAKLFDVPVPEPGKRGRPRKYGRNRLEHPNGTWCAYISSDTSLSIERILKSVSDRWAIEEQFHDVKEIWGAGQQQVRNVWSSIGCWNLCGWLYGLVELACWDRRAEQLVDRSDRPWDNPSRRPSHADRRRQIAREMLRNEFFNGQHDVPDEAKMRTRFERLLALAT